MLLLAPLLLAPALAGAAPILDAYLEPGGTKPISMPPLSWWHAEQPWRPFTAIGSGVLDRIELNDVFVYGSLESFSPSLEFMDEKGALLANSLPADLPQAGWVPFVFDGVSLEAGRQYQFWLPMPEGPSLSIGVNYGIFLGYGRNAAIAYRTWIEPTIVQPRLLGDADNDGHVGLEDFAILKEHFGTDGPEGDFTGDGRVDIHDFGILKDNFGKSGPPVPEPSSLVLLLVGAVALLAAARVKSCAA